MFIKGTFSQILRKLLHRNSWVSSSLGGMERLGAQGLFSWRPQGWGGTQLRSSAAERRGRRYRSQALPRGTWQQPQHPARGITTGHRRRFHPEGGQALLTRVRWCRTAPGGAEQPSRSPGSGYDTSRGPCTQNTSVIINTAPVHIPQHGCGRGWGFVAIPDWPLCGRLYTAFEGFPGSTVLLHCKQAWCGLPARTALPPGLSEFHSTAVTKDMTLEALDTSSQLHVCSTVRRRK